MQDLKSAQNPSVVRDEKNKIYETPKNSTNKQLENIEPEILLDLRSAENSSICWPISNKKDACVFSATP